MDMDMDADSLLKEADNLLKDADNLVDLPIENEEWLGRMNSGNGMFHGVGAPASQVFSVKLHCKSFEQRGGTCEVYGDITIEDVYGTSHVIYSLECDEPETITCVHNALSIDIPNECATSYKWKRMVINLMDGADGTCIVNNYLDFDEVDIDSFDQLKCRRVGGARGHVFVSFVTFSKALLAFVEITVAKKYKSNALLAPLGLNGAIVARHGNTYGEKYPGIVLFNEPTNQSTVAKFDAPIELSREMVVVPTYSFLRIDMVLFDCCTSKPIVNGKVEFLASHFGTSVIEAGDFAIRVHIELFHPLQIEFLVDRPCKMPKVITYPQVRNISKQPYVVKCHPIGFSLLEVFTVMIAHNSSSVPKIYGFVEIHDNNQDCVVFNKDKLSAQILSSKSKTISIEGPSECFKGLEALAMELHLQDVDDQLLIKGFFCWSSSSFEKPISWYDRRICSVCRGIKGYAALYYTLFSRAVQAYVEVSLMSEDPLDRSDHRVDGTIVAWNTKEDYSSEYEKTYYKSVLFSKTDGGFSEVRSGSKIPLLKSVVAVPVDASLIVEVDLYAKSSGEHWNEALAIDIIDPKIDPDPTIGRIEGKNYYVQLCVLWSKLYQFYS